MTGMTPVTNDMDSGPDWPAPPLPTVDTMMPLFQRVCEVRAFELATSELYRDGKIPGFVHVSLGQEASSVGACAPLRRSDMLTSNHRGHGHCLAKGMPPLDMFAELFGREAGTAGGRGGSMHIADPELGILGANGIVAAGLPIAVGAALAAARRGNGDIVVAFFGDGAVAQGMFHEAANLAALWKLPIVFFCENNGYAEFTAVEDGHPVGLRARAGGYGLPYVRLDGMDVWAVSSRMAQVVENVRAGTPMIVESMTARWHGHYEGDQQKYRDPENLSSGLANDPVLIARHRLQELGVPSDALGEIESDVTERVRAAAALAQTYPEPDVSTAGDFVVADRPTVPEGTLHSTGETIKYIEAIRNAMADELDDDPAVVFAGIDVGAGGGVFGVSRGLVDRWPDRVLDTPISETAILGLAVGGAMAGLRPIVEIMYLDFIGVAFDQLLNQAAKLHFMTGGKAHLGLTVRTQFGAGTSAGSQHSQSLEAILAHIPGLTVVMPSNSADAYGLLRAAIQDPNPVVFIENRALYGRRFPAPPRGHRVPIGKAHIARDGADVTVVSYSRMVHECIAVAELLELENISVEVVDLRTISPLDRETILASVEKTSRLVVVHEAVTDFGVGAEIVATVARDGFWYLDAPIERVGAAFSPAPYAPNLERAWLPDRDKIADAVRRTVSIDV